MNNIKKLQAFIKSETFDLIKNNSKEKKMTQGAYLDYIFSEQDNTENIKIAISDMRKDIESIMYDMERTMSYIRKPWWKRMF